MAAPITTALTKSLLCPIKELRLDKTLACGQSFRWKENSPGTWTGVLAGRVWKLSQNDNEILYSTYGGSTCSNHHSFKTDFHSQKEGKRLKKKSVHDLNQSSNFQIEEQNVYISDDIDNDIIEERLLTDYFQLNVNLQELYDQWSHKDANFKEKSQHFQGIRILRQHPVENLFSFICSSNNHISRISSMVEKLCEHYGDPVMEVDGQKYFSFPSISALTAKGVEENLRKLGFGYRAKYISSTAQYLRDNGGDRYLFNLRDQPYEEAKQQLMKLHGVGAKVADCVCLMSMDKAGAIPVDTHVWQIVVRDYIPKLKQSKSLTENIYREIGDHFRSLWGPYAGWAHSVLFTADLKKFKRENPDIDSKVKSKKKKVK